MARDITHPHGRTYSQACPIARSLDVVGERWTLLIVRDLLVGPKRYKDLLLGLPGIGTNLLAARLRELETTGILQRTVLPPPAGSTVYQLTEQGLALQPAILALARWGATFLGPPRETDVLLPSAFFVGLQVVFRAQAAAGLTETYELHNGNQIFQAGVKDGRCTLTEGRTSAPDVVVTLEMQTLPLLLSQSLSLTDALAEGLLKIAGDPLALERFIRIFPVGQAREELPQPVGPGYLNNGFNSS